MTLWQDIRFGARMLCKRPGFTAVAVLTLALGIGANTAIFSVVNAVLLRPLPFEHPERVVQVLRNDTRRGRVTVSFSFPNFTDYRAQNGTFEALTAFTDSQAALTGGQAPEQVTGLNSSADIFRMLGARAERGRLFTPEDEQPGGAPIVVISHGMWERRFGSDPNVLGRQITLAGKPKTIVGVLSADFSFPFMNDPPEFFTTLDPKGEMEKQRGANYLAVIGRLKEGVTLAQAEADMRLVAGRLEEQYPAENAGRSVNLSPAQEELVGDLRTPLLVLLGAVGFVLLIACANVANLMLARAARRGREMAVRVALGASRRRVVRQLLTESLLLSVVGGAAGLLLAVWGIYLISALVPADVPRFKEVGIDPAVLSFTFAASVLTGVVFGLAPALQSSKVDLNESLKEGGRSNTAGRSRSRVRSLLIVSEVALSLVLLVGAALLIKSFMRLQQTSPGFDARNVLTASVSLPEAAYSKEEQLTAFYDRVTEQAAALPGVEAVGAIMPLPLGDNNINISFTVNGQPDPGPGAQPTAGARIITPGYLRAMGVPLVLGRGFTDADTADSPKVIIINQTLARRYFPGEEPLGKRLTIGLNDIDGEVVGVVGDVHDESLVKEPRPEFYVPYKQVPMSSMSLVVRTKGGHPNALAAPLRAVVQSADKDLPVYQIRPMERLISDSVARQRFSMTLLVAFAGLALALAAVGIFSVMSFLVAQRTHEIGVRVALGAQGRDILRLVLGYGMALVLAGIGVGLAGAFALTRLMTALLYGVSATDAMTFAGVPVLLGAVALLACLLPARRATKVDPMVALRYE